MEEYSDLISNCDTCIQKTYTTGCFNCEVYKVKTVIRQLQNEIIKLKACLLYTSDAADEL